MAAQLTATNGPLRRGESSWTVRATSSLPVPLSPAMKSVASVHDQVSDHEIGSPDGGALERSLTIAGRGDVVPPHRQELLKPPARGGLVVDDQDSMILHLIRMAKTLRRDGSSRRFGRLSRGVRVWPRATAGRRGGVRGLSVPQWTLAHDVAIPARAGLA